MIKASAARVALRFAARSGPPSITGSAALLKKQGLTPVDVFFGEARPHRRPIIVLGDMVQTRHGDLLYFAGISEDGNAVLGKDEREAERLHSKIIKNRLHHSTRAASTNTERNFFKAKDDQWYVENEDWNDEDDDEYREPDFTTYGPFRSFEAAEKWMDSNFANSGSYTEDDSGRARVPRDAVKPRRQRMRFSGSQPLQLQPDYVEDHPCQNGGPCQCGGSCGCGGK